MPTKKIDSKDLLKYGQVFVIASGAPKATEVFKARRDRQRRLIDIPYLFAGIDIEPGHQNLWWMNGVRIIQDPALLSLTGINQVGVRLWLHPEDPEQDVLFLPIKKPEKEFWDGLRFGLYESTHVDASKNLKFLQKTLGFKNILSTTDLESFLTEKQPPFSSLYVFHHSYDEKEWGLLAANTKPDLKKNESDHHHEFYTKLKKSLAKHPVTLKPEAKKHLDFRVILDKFQIQDADEATNTAHQAFLALLRKWGRDDNENALSRRLEYYLLRQNPWGLAFPTICASGVNACTLHYLKNDEKLPAHALVLLDFGARHGSQHSDISRTVPVSGKFNPLQALLYQIVLDAQKLNEKFIRPGVTLNEANLRVWSFIEEELKCKFLSLGGKMQRVYDKKSVQLNEQEVIRPHGVSHLMGEQEHEGDPFRLYARTPLQVGMLLSNEPGLYGHFEIVLDGKKYSEWIGIRIEDNLLVTKSGCRNLSAHIPKEINELENLLKKGMHHG